MATLTNSQAADLFRQPPTDFLDVGAGEVAYRRIGTGPDVLFVHGWPVSGATFRTLLPHLVDHVTCHIIDFPGAGSSRFTANTPLSVAQHVRNLRKVVDLLGFDSLAVVGHDAGGLITRHALAGDPRIRSMALINTEQSNAVTLRFRAFVVGGSLPGLRASLRWVCGSPKVYRNRFVFGAAFEEKTSLDGEFAEFFLQPIACIPERTDAAAKFLRNFTMQHLRELPEVHERITVPVQLVWGENDPFFPLKHAQTMVSSFPNAKLAVIRDTGLFCHEEKPEEVAKVLLPTFG
jgi:haloalkane dehalogenase